MSFFKLDPVEFYERRKSHGVVTVVNEAGTWQANSDDVDPILDFAAAAGDSPVDAVSYLLERLAGATGDGIDYGYDSTVELAVMIAALEKINNENPCDS